jgi:hypothetical protein
LSMVTRLWSNVKTVYEAQVTLTSSARNANPQIRPRTRRELIYVIADRLSSWYDSIIELPIRPSP